MEEFSEALPTIRERVERDLSRPGLPREKVLATVVRLLEKTLIRVGSEVYAKNNESFGLTTLKRRHVEVSGTQLRFEFRGKSGIMHRVAVNDGRIARVVQQCQTLPGQELFQYLDDAGKHQDVDSGDINDYLHEITGRDITAKDFRTWAGTMYAATILRETGPPPSERAAKRNIIKATDQVAERLGNSRAVCRKYYIHPEIVRAYQEGKVVGWPPRMASKRRRRATAALRRDEIEVLKFLRSCRKRQNETPGSTVRSEQKSPVKAGMRLR
jgi:DNA topoisomerase-1